MNHESSLRRIPASSLTPNPTPPQLLLAPLRGLTDYILRGSLQHHLGGFDLGLAPFISTVERLGPRKARYLDDVLPRKNEYLPVIPQFLGNNPEQALRLCHELHQLGHREVNWNLGCPFAPVTRKRRGAGLLPHPELVAAFLGAFLPNSPVRLSVKVRLGLTDPDELFGLLPVLADHDLSSIILHPRTALQEYSGTVDLGRFEQVLAQCPHPVIYNGDLVDVAGFTGLLTRFGPLPGWMIGRGAIHDPTLAARIKGRTFDEAGRRLALETLHQDLSAAYLERYLTERMVLDRLKQLFRYLARNFEAEEEIFTRVKRCKELAPYTEEALRILREAPMKPLG